MIKHQREKQDAQISRRNKMSKFKVGDRVRIRSDRGDGWNHLGEMDKYCGKIATVSQVIETPIGTMFRIKGDEWENMGLGWRFGEEDAELFVEKFKVGDRVVGNRTSRKFSGLHGTVNSIRMANMYNIEWDDDVGGHNIDGRCEWGHGWTVNGCALDPEPKTHPTIVIYADGKTTTALLKNGKEVVRKAIARCHPKDEFNFEVGAALAFKRLLHGEIREIKYPPQQREFATDVDASWREPNDILVQGQYLDAFKMGTFIGDFVAGRTAVKCRTRKESDAFVDFLCEKKYITSDGSKHDWDVHGPSSYYFMHDGNRLYNRSAWHVAESGFALMPLPKWFVETAERILAQTDGADE